jgi:hypothetical protein
MFTKAVKHKAYGRMALIGVSGSGKTMTALKIATSLVSGAKVAVIDTEHGSASKYADLFDFSVVELTSFAPQQFIQAIKAAESAGFDVLIIDSLSHAWMGTDGILEIKDRITANSKSGNDFQGWGKVTPQHNQLIEAILGAKLHVIATMRSKMKHVQEDDPNRPGKTRIVKLGMEAVQRDGLEYEFDIIGEMDTSNTMTITKTRCSELRDGVFTEPGKDVAEIVAKWLNTGEGQPVVPPTSNPEASAYTGEIEEPAKPARQAGLLKDATEGKGEPPAKPKNEPTGDMRNSGVFGRTRQPMQPDELKKAFDRAQSMLLMMTTDLDAQIAPAKAKALAMRLDEALNTNATERHAFNAYYFGHESTTEFARVDAAVVYEWLNSNVNTAAFEFDAWREQYAFETLADAS